MKLQFFKNNSFRILTILTLMTTWSSVFASMTTEGTRRGKIEANSVNANITATITKVLEKDCVSCSPDIAPGYPLTGNRSATAIAQVSNKALTQEEKNFYSYLTIYCMTLPEIRGERDFKKRMIDAMAKTATDGNMDAYWTEPGCEPNYIANTSSPLIHIVAQNSTDRMQYMVYLQKYYTARNDFTTFRKILNAKNTQGQTVLDYIQHSFSGRRFARQEEPGLNEFIKFLCANGAEYAQNKDRKCPGEYLYLYK